MHIRSISKSLNNRGFAAQDFDLLMLLPAVVIAWADNAITPAEIATIQALYDSDCSGRTPALGDSDCRLQLVLSPGARQHFATQFLRRPPELAIMRPLFDQLAELLEMVSYHDAQQLRDGIAQACHDVAKSSGGFLGFGRISAQERAVMADLADRLRLHQGHKATELLAEMMIYEENEPL